MAKYVTRLCWNTDEWEKPSGLASTLEDDTFAVQFGFGFEEWLFSSKLELDGVRYGFVQGVNKSQRRLAGHDIGLILYTIDPNHQRFFEAEIQRCQVLTRADAEKAHAALEKAGAIEQMKQDVLAVGSDADFIRNRRYAGKWTTDIINIRYRPGRLVLYSPRIMVPGNSRLWNYSRYQLQRADKEPIEAWISAAQSKDPER
jgi:hypothetical protein